MGQPPAQQPPPPPVPPPAAPAPPPAPGYAAPGYAPGYAEPKWNGMAIAGFVLAITCFSLLGTIFSAVALAQINKEPQRYKGKGLAIAGLVLGIVMLGLILILAFTGVLAGIFGAQATVTTY
jgi:hypothetical protein